jgi:hypothetical protein
MYFSKKQVYMRTKSKKIAGRGGAAALTTVAAVLMLDSCDVPVDRGVYNPINAPADQLATVTIAPNLAVSKVNNYQVHWMRPDNNYSQVVKVSPGIHMFEISYNDGVTWTMQPIAAIVKFEAGGAYTIRQIINGANISIKIVAKKNGVEESALFKMNSLSDDDGPLAVYVKSVFNPTLISTEGKVLLSGDSEDILFESDLVYRKTDKKTEKETAGRYVIEMDFTMDGRIYLLETDIDALSSEDFLKSNFRQEAQTIVTPIFCDGETVTFLYSKPEYMTGSEADYTITDLTPASGNAE